ncbi:unnamed protein product [Bursaphelenchus xylophilus]|uniref:(pine wood nematode) hypothetical protein n=1 Tax=Bursaphelenchus xylophilus TaxID=6326 RepID=A0A1I7S169_BURXY|nr:unnamed protein product [Bursaphelenchus xylophilus]CAG9080049.1 unnamed protein product [Bursaphelenchus xylophilus]
MFRQKSTPVPPAPKVAKPETAIDEEKFYRTVITPSEFIMMERGVRRRIIVDGCNFMGDSGNKAKDINYNTDKFNPTSILILVYDLLHYGFDVHVYIKEYFKNNYNDMDKTTVNIDILNVLSELKIVTVLPDGEDDDMQILQDAEKTGGVILSKDKFRQDVYRKYPSRLRRVGFTVKSTGGPADRGSYEARLHNCIKIVFDQEFRWLSYVLPGEPDYDLVKKTHDSIDIDARLEALEKLSVLADWYFLEEATCSGNYGPFDFIEYFDGRELDHKFEKFWRKYLMWRKREELRRGL